MFRGEPGCMNAIISCKEHDHSRRQIYEICETDDGGEVSYRCTYSDFLKMLTSFLQSALQVYCRAYKQVPQVSQTHALLRKARRLDQLITVRPESSGPVADFPSEDLQCVKCSTHFTPKFYQTESGWLCHACNFKPLPIATANHDMSGGIVNTLKLRSPTLQPESLSVSGSEVLVNWSKLRLG